jgi:hypothetical protein
MRFLDQHSVDRLLRLTRVDQAVFSAHVIQRRGMEEVGRIGEQIGCLLLHQRSVRGVETGAELITFGFNLSQLPASVSALRLGSRPARHRCSSP